MSECPYDELAAEWSYWMRMTPKCPRLGREANAMVREAIERLIRFGIAGFFPEDVYELAMAFADGCEA